MAYELYIPATRTDPSDTVLVVDRDEVEEAVIAIMRDEGMTPNTVTLDDDYTQDPIEIEVAEWLEFEELVALEALHITQAQGDH